MTDNLAILDETKAVVSALDTLLRETIGEPWKWEVTSITNKGPRAFVCLYVPHRHLLSAAATVASYSKSWQYLYPLQFEVNAFRTKTTTTLRELGDRNDTK